MKQNKLHKVDQKHNSFDKTKHAKMTSEKVKYNHKNHWIEEEEEMPIRIKKKKKP